VRDSERGEVNKSAEQPGHCIVITPSRVVVVAVVTPSLPPSLYLFKLLSLLSLRPPPLLLFAVSASPPPPLCCLCVPSPPPLCCLCVPSLLLLFLSPCNVSLAPSVSTSSCCCCRCCLCLFLLLPSSSSSSMLAMYPFVMGG